MKLSTGIAALSFVFASAAFAQAQTQTQNPAVNPGSSKMSNGQFSTLDTNKDGRVSRDEVKSHAELTSSFTTLDSDHDTYLSESEFGKYKPAPSGMTAPAAGKSPSMNGAQSPGNSTPSGNGSQSSGSSTRTPGSSSSPGTGGSPQSTTPRGQ